jgi:enoyl-CoA hydratase
MSASQISCQIHDRVATVCLHNPGKLNAINLAMWDSLHQTFCKLSADTELHCVIVRGADGNFAAGADIAEFASVRSDLSQGMRYHNHSIARALEAIATCVHPTIAAIQGACVGGGLEIAAQCDLRIAAPDARFGIPINRLGFPLAPGELQGLLALVGKATALEILLEGRIYDAAAAQTMGLIHRIADPLDAEIQAAAARILRGAPLAARMNKQLIRRLTAQADALTESEMLAAFAFLETRDYREGVNSFLEKRPPQFTGE